MFLGHQVHRGRHGHGWHAEAGRQRLHGARHHAQPRPSFAGPKPFAPRRGASKGLVIPALQGREETRRSDNHRPRPLHFSTAFCLIKAAACEATSSSRRSVPRASTLLNSLSRTCRAWRKKEERKRAKKRAQRQSHYQQGTQSNCGLTS